jgi:hypothetical protein
MNDASPAHDTALERQALAWMEDPYGAFGMSNTAVHSVPRAEAEAVQLAALNLRLAQRRTQIPVLAKLADGQGIGAVDTLDAGASLLFTHDIYKSYPTTLLTKQRFKDLTRWLDRLTPHDLTGLDVTGCGSIDEWLVKLRTETPMDVATSSGTSGTLSFFPRSQRDYRISVTGLRVQLIQRFGTPPAAGDVDEPIHVLTPFYRDGHSTVARLPAYFLEVFCKGDPALLHTALPFKLSADMMWLAARLRAAEAIGDASRVEIPQNLLARRAEWETLQKETPERQAAFIRELVPQLAGQRVLALGITSIFYPLARQGLDAGVRGGFAPGSAVMGGGGAKGGVLPDDADQVIADFFGVDRVRGGYGMTEQNWFLTSCEHDHFHMPPWVAVLLLDPESGLPLPREGVQTGRGAFFDPSHDGGWGGIVTGDRISVDYRPCPCGRTTLHLDKKIQRFSELGGGGDDKISCSATPAAQDAALDYLNSFGG